MIHLALPFALVAILAGAGVYGVIARRNAVLVLIGVELILNAANLLFVTVGSISERPAAHRARAHAVRHHHRRRRDRRRAGRRPRALPQPRKHRPHRAGRMRRPRAAERPARRPGARRHLRAGARDHPPPAAVHGGRARSGRSSRCSSRSASWRRSSGWVRPRRCRPCRPCRSAGWRCRCTCSPTRCRRSSRSRSPWSGSRSRSFTRWYLRERPPLRRVRRHRLALPRGDAAGRPVRRPGPHPGRVGGHGLVLVPAHRPRQPA